ncbi:hydrolase [Adhaeribacter arboris]|uniref:Hydrolase n=1 Tax=Adhaeribacter arboris TaxID=2072846 RepID=A0A2T2YGV5_9BACT|nr:amidohydrolase family protein [Adhaeribacter arboris]PSR54739.1 hydrolase [Adhaeribacter arboris]
MKKNTRYWSLLTFLFLIFLQACSPKKQNAAATAAATTTKQTTPETYYALDDFKSVKKFDTHVHINTTDPALIKQAEEDNFRLLTINVDAPHYPEIAEQQQLALIHVKAFPERIAYATTISVQNFNAPDWQNKTIAYLKDSFAKGAVAVKFWKNIGMELKDNKNKFVMVDNPQFDPIVDYITQNKKTLIAHLGEPRNCWLPLEKMTVNGDKNYYREHPQYHMYRHPEYPSYEQHIQARDHMVTKHPDVTFVGAHLGSLEWSVDELAKRLDKFPNMAVDMAARIPHFQYQAVKERQKVRDFFIKYQDRLIYATDLVFNKDKSSAEIRKQAHETWSRDWKFFTSDENMSVPSIEGTFTGLKVPREVVDKIYYQNAEKRFSGTRQNNGNTQ